MFRSLRKGDTSIEIISGNYYETINSKDTTLLLENNKVTISTTLNPIDENQEEDISYILVENKNLPNKVLFNDKQIRERIESFFTSYQKDIKDLELKIKYDKSYQFKINISPFDKYGLTMSNRK